MKAIYGLKQALRVWRNIFYTYTNFIETFDDFARSIGFQVSAFDPCLSLRYDCRMPLCAGPGQCDADWKLTHDDFTPQDRLND